MFSWLQSGAEGERVESRKPVLHPEAGEAWFRALPHERRARMNREWREGLGRTEHLQRTRTKKLLRAGLVHALGFAVINGFCIGDGGATYFVAACAGMVLGMVLEWLRVARLLSAVTGMAVFGLFLLLTRGGLSVLHFFWFVLAGGFCSYLGIEREES